VVTYQAGWLMPDDAERNLPADLEAAAIAMIKAARFIRDRDPTLRKESFLQRDYEYEVFEDKTGAGFFVGAVKATLDRYRPIMVG